jgi:chromosome condensin MukBEF ATPase and DNA-binding subunit MukB
MRYPQVQAVPLEGECMADLDAVLEQLQKERERAVGELRQLEKVIAELSKVTVRSLPASYSSRKRMKRQLSAAARERIAAAQRARWAKVRAQSKQAS